MTHAHPNCPKRKLHHVMVVQVCTVNGQNGQFAVPIVPVESLVACNITTVAPIQLSKNALVVLIAGPPGLSGPLAVQHVLVNGLDVKLISVVPILSKRQKSVVAVVIS